MTKKLTFLKNSCLGILLMTLFSFSASAQQWDTVGVAGFSDSTVLYQDLDVHNDTAYVAYRDASNQNKLRVQMYDGSSWVDVGGQNISTGAVGTLDLLVVASDNIYVAYTDGANGNGITLMRYNGTTWSPVGTTILTSGSGAMFSAANPSLAYDRTQGVIHIAYDDIAITTGNPPSEDIDVKVQKFVSGNWISLGTIASGTVLFNSIIGQPNLKFSSNGTLYITYVDADIKVKRYTGTSWLSLGGANTISSGFGTQPDLEINSSGELYVAFRDEDNSNKTTVAKYTNSWAVVGTAGFTGGTSDKQDLALDNTDIPYVTQVEGSTNKDITVYAFNGTNWTDIGTGMATAYSNVATYASTNLEIASGVAYLAFTNENNKSTVMKYDLTTSITQIPTLNKDITIYPNPTKAQLTIEGVEGIETIRILTMDGKVMQTITTNSNTISVEALPQGIYTIEVITTEGTGYKNFVKQ
jgi:hypothetical protein